MGATDVGLNVVRLLVLTRGLSLHLVLAAALLLELHVSVFVLQGLLVVSCKGVTQALMIPS